MRVADFDFDLPEERIALRPAQPRDSARLLVVNEALVDARVSDLCRFLKAGDVLVVNDTRVLPVQLSGERLRDGATAGIEATLIKCVSGSVWQAFLKPGRRVRVGDRVRFGPLEAEVAEKTEDGVYTLHFEAAPAQLLEGLHEVGAMPLPPYIRRLRKEDLRDASDYQTVFANEAGSVAAPTAGLHFTSDLLRSIEKQGITTERVTLHVGAGTFLPVKVDDTRDHVMHAEYGVVPEDVAQRLNAARARGGRIVCVGTTSLRLLESACDDDGVIHPFAAETSIFIIPGVKVRSTDILLTNFHLPKSTLFMLVCAFAGMDTMKAAYKHAIDSGYRFFSYGDASLLTNASRQAK